MAEGRVAGAQLRSAAARQKIPIREAHRMEVNRALRDEKARRKEDENGN